jgi:hypothetical protein
MGRLLAMSFFEKAFQATEGVIPLFRDQLEMSVYVGEAPLFQLPDALAPMSGAAHETGLFHHTQMFRNRLPGDRKVCSQPRD